MIHSEHDVPVLRIEVLMKTFELLLPMWPDHKGIVHVFEP